MTFGKRQLVIAALVASLGAAVYLNWQFTGVSSAVETGSEESSDSALGKTTYVNTEPESVSVVQESGSDKKAGEKTGTDKEKKDDGVFSEERAKRLQSNAEAIEAINEAAESVSSSEEAKKQAEADAAQLARIIKIQGDLESLIRLRGFDDVFVSINSGSCTVNVSGGEASEENLLIIRDLVNRHSGIGFDKITVTQVKSS